MAIPIRRWTALACALALAAGTLAACGSGDDASSSSGGTTSSQPAGGGQSTSATASLDESAVESGGLSFSKDALTAKAGTVTITLSNPSENQLPHAIEVEGNGVEEETETIQPGGSAAVTVDLKPGTYEFYCPIDGHRAQGMEGTLTVQ
ncbi:MAG: plastocyanin/azurin family copper-binding protein [Conexibacter sp.]